jgi:hypothetical protein
MLEGKARELARVRYATGYAYGAVELRRNGPAQRLLGMVLLV